MAMAYTVDVQYKQINSARPESSPKVRQQEVIWLMRHGLPIAQFYDLELADQCARILNESVGK